MIMARTILNVGEAMNDPKTLPDQAAKRPSMVYVTRMPSPYRMDAVFAEAPWWARTLRVIGIIG
jgi:hypothetical protein